MTPAEIEEELERLHTAGFAWALACCGRDREEALDALQASYVKVLEGKARFAGHSSFKTFLFGVVRRTASEARRRRALRAVLLGEWGANRRAASLEAAPEDRITLLSALARLSLRQRQVLELVFGHGLTVEEAAETLAISAGTARIHYDRAKRRLRNILEATRPDSRSGP